MAKRGCGVCYEGYELGGRPGYSFIFEYGGHDGFSPEDVALILDVTGRVRESVADYVFEDVGKLARDHEAGRFAPGVPQAGVACMTTKTLTVVY